MMYLNCKTITNTVNLINEHSFVNKNSFLNLLEHELNKKEIIIKEYNEDNFYIKFGHNSFNEEIEACLNFNNNFVKITFI